MIENINKEDVKSMSRNKMNTEFMSADAANNLMVNLLIF